MDAPPRPDGLSIRARGDSESWEDITALLHRGYASLAARGWNYTAVDQDAEATRRRAEGGTCLVALQSGRLVGTLAMRPGRADDGHPRFSRPGVVALGQFAVEPGLQRRGIGRALMEEAERRARAAGASTLVGDTAEGAAHLIGFYEGLGFSVVDRVHWGGKTYDSVILAKDLV